MAWAFSSEDSHMLSCPDRFGEGLVAEPLLGQPRREQPCCGATTTTFRACDNIVDICAAIIIGDCARAATIALSLCKVFRPGVVKQLVYGLGFWYAFGVDLGG